MADSTRIGTTLPISPTGSAPDPRQKRPPLKRKKPERPAASGRRDGGAKKHPLHVDELV